MSHFARVMVAVAFFALTGVVLTPAAHADALRGFVQKSQNVKYLIVQNADNSTSSLVMSGASDSVTSSINSLHNGDFLIGRGTITGKVVSVDSIESLGLQALVGVWASQRNEVYEFRDFSRLNLYLPNKDQSDIVKAAELQYSVAPDSGPRYQLFLSNQSQVTIGTLEFRKRHLMITTIDPKTGEVSASVQLSPLATH